MKKIIVANWKMYLSTQKAILLAGKLKTVVHTKKVIIAPSYTALSGVGRTIEDSDIELAAQNVSWDGYGAYTGEVCALDLKELKCKYVILGHSERRKHFKETYETVNKRVQFAIKNKLIPIVCVGENLRERRSGHAWRVLKHQLDVALKRVDKHKIMIAYEPIWAIGTGHAEDPADANKIHAHIKSHLKNGTKVLYGGSVNVLNYKKFLQRKNIDGLLVGGASVKLNQIKEIIK